MNNQQPFLNISNAISFSERKSQTLTLNIGANLIIIMLIGISWSYYMDKVIMFFILSCLLMSQIPALLLKVEFDKLSFLKNEKDALVELYSSAVLDCYTFRIKKTPIHSLYAELLILSEFCKDKGRNSIVPKKILKGLSASNIVVSDVGLMNYAISKKMTAALTIVFFVSSLLVMAK